jgi:ATP-binding cassette subfamily G (WHITE) protein 2 (SNQ2)
MLDVIGAGATATSAQDWDAIWRGSSEAARNQDEVEAYYAEGRNRPAVTADLHSEFAAPWLYQVKELSIREASLYCRDPTYLIAAKIALNVLAGLVAGFTFYQSKDTQQGTQNKLFVSSSSFYFFCRC